MKTYRTTLTRPNDHQIVQEFRAEHILEVEQMFWRVLLEGEILTIEEV